MSLGWPSFLQGFQQLKKERWQNLWRQKALRLGADLVQRVIAVAGAEKLPSCSLPLRHRLRVMPKADCKRRLDKGLVCRLISLWEPSSCVGCWRRIRCLLLRTLCDADSSTLGAQATVQLQRLPKAIAIDRLPNFEISDSEAHSLYPAAQVWSGRPGPGSARLGIEGYSLALMFRMAAILVSSIASCS